MAEPTTPQNKGLEELCSLAQCASQQVCEFLLDNLIDPDNRLKPTPNESTNFVHAVAFTIAYLELYLKLHLPEDQRDDTRQILDAFSSAIKDHVKLVESQKKDLTNPPEGVIIE